MTLAIVWDRIAEVSRLEFHAESDSTTRWAGSGVGTVEVTQPASNVLVYEETGTWKPSGGKQLAFTNVYRWTRLSQTLRLEHLRFGAENPVYLFDLATVDDSQLASVEPHV